MMKKITFSQVCDFTIKYDQWGYPGQRFGQAFMNEFDIQPDQELFYTNDRNQAVNTIWSKYVEV